MSKRLGKDLRNKFIAEFEKDGKISDPNYYAIKDKNGKIQIRRVKDKKESSSDSGTPPPDSNSIQPAPEDPPTPPSKPAKEKTL